MLRIITAGLIAITSLICVVTAHVAELDLGGCSIGPASEPSAVYDACTARLQAPGLSESERTALLLMRGRALAWRGLHKAAGADFALATLLTPTSLEAHFRYGRNAYFLGDNDLALKEARLAIALDSTYAPAHYVRGLVMARLDRRSEAYASFTAAARLKPDDGLFGFALFNFLNGMLEQRAALAEADRILALPLEAITRPHDAVHDDLETTVRTSVRISRARLLRKMGRLAEADAAFDEAVRDDPSAVTYARRAAHRFAQTADDLVEADLDQALALNPNTWFARRTLGFVRLRQRNFVAAEAEFARALAIKPSWGELHWGRALALRALGRSDEAVAEAVATVDVESSYFLGKLQRMRDRGYLPPDIRLDYKFPDRPLPPSTVSALRDAVSACILDEGCT